MNTLTLLPVAQAAKTMSSREIAELTGKDLSNVHRDIRSMLIELYGSEHVEKVIPEHRRNRHSEFIRENAEAILNAIAGQDSKGNHQDRRGFAWERDNRGYVTVFHLDRELTDTLLTGYSAIARRKVVARWHELEAEKQASQQHELSRIEILQIAMQAEQERLALEHKVTKLTPKAEALDRISAGDEALTITQAAKVLGMKVETLTTWMHANGWIYRQNESWVAYDQHIKNGRLKYKEARYTDEKTLQKVIRPYCHILPKGLTFLAQQFSLVAA